MAKANSHSRIPLHVDDFRGSPRVARMTWAERGAYLYLLMACWEGGGAVQDTPEALAEALGVELEEVGACVTERVRRCFEATDGQLVSPRLVAELERSARARELQAERGRRSAQARAARFGSAQPGADRVAPKATAERAQAAEPKAPLPEPRFEAPRTAVRELPNRGSTGPEPWFEEFRTTVRRAPNQRSESSEPSEASEALRTEEEACFSLDSRGSQRDRAELRSAQPYRAPPTPSKPAGAPGLAQDRSAAPLAQADTDRPQERAEAPTLAPAPKPSPTEAPAAPAPHPKPPVRTHDGEFDIARSVLRDLGVDVSPRWGILARLQALAADHGRPLGDVVKALADWLRAERRRRPVANPGGLIHGGLEAGWLAARIGLTPERQAAPGAACPGIDNGSPARPEYALQRAWDWALEEAVLRLFAARRELAALKGQVGPEAALARGRAQSHIASVLQSAGRLTSSRGTGPTLAGVVEAHRAQIRTAPDGIVTQHSSGLAGWRHAEAHGSLRTLGLWAQAQQPHSIALESVA